jgi:hypothetical protein
MNVRTATLLIALAPASAIQGQWLNYPTPGIPRTADGKPKLSAKAPRASDGKPDLSGLWQNEPAPPEFLERYVPGATNGAGEEPLTKYFLNILSDFQPEEEPLRPEAAAALRERRQSFSEASPLPRCLPEGMPLVEMAPAPFKIVQMRGMTIVLYERDTTFRQIYTDGRSLPADPQPSWLGYSVGKWDGDSFVVDTIGFNDRGWLDARGHTHSEALHLTERFHRLDFGHMELRLTIDDPRTYTRPFSVTLEQHLLPDSDVLESFCSENEKDVVHLGK